MSIDKIIHESQGYEDGVMHFESELRMLNRICDGIHEHVIVVIGSYRGQMDCAIALHAHVPIYAIDPRQTWEGESRQFGDEDRYYWIQNVISLGLERKIRPIELPSVDVSQIWTRPISLLFVDGDHVAVKADLDAWMPFVVDGGLVALHDSNSPMIIEAVASRNDIVEIERGDLTVVYRKEPLYTEHTYDNLTLLVRKGPYEHDDRYVLGEVRSYDIGTDPVQTCIDIGGHIGAFTAWIKQLNPDAQVVVIEPEVSNQMILSENVGHLHGVRIIYGMVGYHPQQMALLVNPINSGCHRTVPTEVVPTGQAAIYPDVTITIEQIVKNKGWSTLDLLKIDCEGAEVDILMNCSDEVLQTIRRIVGEFHNGYDAFMFGIGARLKGLGFDVKGEQNPLSHATFVAVNQNWLGEDDPTLVLDYATPAVEEPKKLKTAAKRGRKAKK